MNDDMNGDMADLQDDQDLAFEHLDYAVENGVAVITLQRPEALNALNGQLLLELNATFELAEADATVQALVIHGEGRAFAAGADVANLAQLADVFSGREESLNGQAVMGALAALPFPTIAAIHGYALGGGLELALACDLRVASPDAKLGLPEVGLGLIPGYGGSQRLPRLIGASRALDLILTGRHVPADEALAMGLVNRLANDALATAMQIARQTMRNAPVALGLAKEAVVRGMDLDLPRALEVEADLFGMVVTTADMKEGTAAFLEKRKAEFQGN